MPAPPVIKIYERFDSREIAQNADSPTVDLVYMLEGSEDESLIGAFLTSNLPAQYGDLFLESYHLVHLGGGVWEATARYAPPVLETTFSFETGGGSQHIVQPAIKSSAAIFTLSRPAPSLPMQSFKTNIKSTIFVPTTFEPL